jgi:acyl dehydratase
MAERWFEDYPPGAVFAAAGTNVVTADDIIEFARKYDPQAMHTDPDAAART